MKNLLISLALLAIGTSACTVVSENDEHVPSVEGASVQPNEICLTCPPDSEGGGGPPPEGPDLRPVTTTGNLCDQDPWGRLTVKIRNSGNRAAVASTTRVRFWWGPVDRAQFQIVTVQTPALAVGATASHAVAMPPSCWDPDCSFSIQADASSANTETNETNNSATGTCTW